MPNEKDRLLELADARRTCALWGPLETGAKWIRKLRRLCLSSLRRNVLLKVNKKVSYLNKKSLRVFEFRDSYVLSLWTLYVHFVHSVNCEYDTNEDNARLSPNPPDTQNSRWLQSLFPSTANKTFAKLRQTQSLARPTIRVAFSTFSLPHFVSILTTFPTRLAAQTQTLYSMLQIKTIPKNISTSYIFEPSPLYT